MTAKTSARRRAAFFRALSETGNQTLAAERAKVSRSWVRLHRSTDPAFRAELEAAVAAAKARLDRASDVGPARAWRTQAGEELAVRGSNGRWTQVARAREKQWTPRVEARFLAALAQCCNVKRACAEVGLSVASAYGHRRRWPAFGERWDQAVEDGYDHLAGLMVAHSGAMLGDADMVSDAVVGPLTVPEILQVLHLYRGRVTDRGKPPGYSRRPPVQLADVRGSILDKLEVIERAIQAKMTPEERETRQAMMRGEIPLPHPA